MVVAMMIAGMTAILFFNRYVFLEPRLPLKLGPKLREFLDFAVPGMLTAICGPILFLRDGEFQIHWNDPYLLAGAVAVALVLLTRHTLLSMLASMAVFFLLKFWL